MLSAFRGSNRRILLCLIVLLGISTPALAENIHIIFFSRLPNMEKSNTNAGLASAAGFINAQRVIHPDLFVFHGGESLSPSILSSMDRGAHMIGLLNDMEIDAMSVGKREFTYGEDNLIQRASEALFPLMTSNLIDAATRQPFTGISIGELMSTANTNIGILGITSPTVTVDYMAVRTSVLPHIEQTVLNANRLRREGAEIVILMADFHDQAFLNLLKDGTVDLILGTDSKENSILEVGAGLYVQQGKDPNYFFSIEIDIDVDSRSNQRRSSIKARSVNIMDHAPDELVEQEIQTHVASLISLLNKPIVKSTSTLDTRRTVVRTLESAFANLLTDSMREAVSADIALINGGSIRGNTTYPAGHILTRRDIQAELPFRNTVTKSEITGQQILDAMKASYRCKILENGCFLHGSNIIVQYNVDKDIEDPNFLNISISGKPIDKEKIYTLATTDFLSSGGDGLTTLMSSVALIPPNRQLLTRDILVQYLLDRTSISPKIEGRILFNDDKPDQ